VKDSVKTKGSVSIESDPDLKATAAFFRDSVEWLQVARIKSTDSLVIKGVLRYMYKSGSEFLNGEEAFRFFIEPGKNLPNVSAETGKDGSMGDIGNRSLWWVFIAAFGGGLLALLTPCVNSMIPVTVSFFTKRSLNRKEGIRNALLYAASIVIIFTLLGFLLTVVFGPAALNHLATNWIATLIFFALYLFVCTVCLGIF